VVIRAEQGLQSPTLTAAVRERNALPDPRKWGRSVRDR
jgi:hypothetical protein